MIRRPTTEELRAAIWEARQDAKVTMGLPRPGPLEFQPEETMITVEMEVRAVAALIRDRAESENWRLDDTPIANLDEFITLAAGQTVLGPIPKPPAGSA